MPRSPIVYSPPPGTVPQQPLTPIPSAAWNGFVNDVTNTLNLPQPVEYGGTAGTTAISGHDGLTTKGANVATAATLNLDTATGAFVDLTGTTTVTAVTLSDGRHRMARATGAFQITVGASLIGNAGGSNINVEVGDLIIFEGYSAGVVRFWLVRATGQPVVTTTLFHVVDEKPSGTNSGAAVAGINQRALNTVRTNEIVGASLSGNLITLPAGTYWIEAEAAMFSTDRSRLFLVDNAAPTTSIFIHGTDAYAASVSSQGNVSYLGGRLTIATSTTFQLRHYLQTASATRGLGVETNTPSLPEVFSQFKAWKIR